MHRRRYIASWGLLLTSPSQNPLLRPQQSDNRPHSRSIKRDIHSPVRDTFDQYRSWNTILPRVISCNNSFLSSDLKGGYPQSNVYVIILCTDRSAFSLAFVPNLHRRFQVKEGHTQYSSNLPSFRVVSLATPRVPRTQSYQPRRHIPHLAFRGVLRYRSRQLPKENLRRAFCTRCFQV